jgi:hypothetical protein
MSIDSVVLSEALQLELSRIAQSRSLPAGYVFRARLILMLAKGASFSTIKQRLGTTAPTISRWKQRFLASGMDGLDTSHPGQSASVLTPKLRARLSPRCFAIKQPASNPTQEEAQLRTVCSAMPNIKIARDCAPPSRLSISVRALPDQANCDLLSARFCKCFAAEPDDAITNIGPDRAPENRNLQKIKSNAWLLLALMGTASNRYCALNVPATSALNDLCPDRCLGSSEGQTGQQIWDRHDPAKCPLWD